ANETTASASDANPLDMISGWNDYRSDGNIRSGFALSRDGGATIDIAILFLILTSILVAITRKLTGRGITVTGPLLVLRRFELNPEGVGKILEVEGRATGLMSWILTTLGLETVTTLSVDSHGVSVRGVSLSGRYKQEIPHDRVDSTLGAYSQSITALAVAGVIGFLGIVRALIYVGSDGIPFALRSLIGTAIIVGIYVLYYFFSRRLILAVTAGNEKAGLGFKRGVLGSMQVDFALVEQAVQMIDAQILQRPLSESSVLLEESTHAPIQDGNLDEAGT
ncbi:MAG: hypothetical protein ACR2GY_05410, partial [Phycisphaerales bacterium]